MYCAKGHPLKIFATCIAQRVILYTSLLGTLCRVVTLVNIFAKYIRQGVDRSEHLCKNSAVNFAATVERICIISPGRVAVTMVVGYLSYPNYGIRCLLES